MVTQVYDRMAYGGRDWLLGNHSKLKLSLSLYFKRRILEYKYILGLFTSTRRVKVRYGGCSERRAAALPARIKTLIQE